VREARRHGLQYDRALLDDQHLTLGAVDRGQAGVQLVQRVGAADGTRIEWTGQQQWAPGTTFLWAALAAAAQAWLPGAANR